MTPEPPRSLRLDIDEQALAANWRALDSLSGSANAGAAVKADAYGLGVAKVMPVLRDAGCKDYFVAHWSEVAGVAQHVAPSLISVLHGPITQDDAHYARATGVRPVINSLPQARLWLESGGGACDLMVDTGMNRLGLELALLRDPAIGQLDVRILMSHLASADEDTAQNEQQRKAFNQACAIVPAQRRSLANSAGITLGETYHYDLTRPGLSLYGGVQRPELAEHIRQVGHLSAALIQIRQLAAGDRVGYNATFTAQQDLRVGIVSLGYADGFLRCWGEKGSLSHGAIALPLVGRVSMDMVAVDLTAAPQLKEGDWLEVPYDLPIASRLSGLSQYELLTTIGQRYAR